METKTVLVNFNAGYGLEYKNESGSTVTSVMCLDEHGDMSILSGNHDMFKDFLELMKKEFSGRIQKYYDTLEDVEKLKDLKLKTISPSDLLSRYDERTMGLRNISIFRHDIGNIAMVRVFIPSLYDEIMTFLDNFPKEKEHITKSGTVARDGVTTLDSYTKLIEEIVLPKYRFLKEE